MENEKARDVLLCGDWFNHLPEEHQDTGSEVGNELVDAIDMARQALEYNVKIVTFNHKNTLHVTVPEGTPIDRVFVTQSGTNYNLMYYPD